MNRFLAGGLLVAMLCAPAWSSESPAGAKDNTDSFDGGAVAEVLRLGLVLETMVVTASLMSDPYHISTNPRQPRLPLPAHDGGSYLKSIPGFSLSRKGGTSGDPELRGLGGSRLGILLDNAAILGGCGGRMDPPTAYVFPEAYDRIEILKGPQSVRHGASAAGVVRFERDRPNPAEGRLSGYFAGTVGSFDRRDLTSEVTMGGTHAYARVIGTWSEQDDFKDGDGNRIHSRYERWSTTGVLGWMPDDRTWIEFAYDRSDAEAAYDDRMMDGTVFDRIGYTLKASRHDLQPWLTEIEAMVFYNYIDHVMDNYTMREPPMRPAVGYPDRRTRGARLAFEIAPRETTEISLGLDYTDNVHANNSLRGPDVVLFGTLPREDNAEFSDKGLFVEVAQQAGERGRVSAGLRVDRHHSEVLDKDDFGGAPFDTTLSSTHHSGFIRYSHEMNTQPLVFYTGLGRAERAADYWERRRVFDLSTEVLTQFDVGFRHQAGRTSWTLAMFYGKFDDYILINAPGIDSIEASNIDATTYGGEFDLSYLPADHWRLTTSLAWVRSTNDTDNVPLAQTPPLEGTLGLDYDNKQWFAGGLWRAVARQDRIHPGHGTIYSLDTAETPGFAVLSVYGGRHLGKSWTLTGGIDNLLDRQYEEHVQRGSADLGALASRIPEPGRSFWLRVNGNF
jgi:iron complex outermembrane recepter protein